MHFSHHALAQFLIILLSVSFVDARADPSISKELKVLNNQGIVQYISGDYSKALATFQKALTIIEKMPNKETKNRALSYECIADTYKAIGNYSKALEYAQKALMIDEKIFGKEHFIIAERYTSVGSIYQLMENYPKALKNFQQAQAIYTSLYGKEGQTTVTGSLSICDVYSAMGERSKAQDCNITAFVILDNIYRKIHPRNKSKGDGYR